MDIRDEVFAGRTSGTNDSSRLSRPFERILVSHWCLMNTTAAERLFVSFLGTLPL